MTDKTADAITALAKIDETILGVASKFSELVLSDANKEKVAKLAKLASPEIEGIEGGNRRFRIPIIQLRQPISNSKSIPESCKPGQLYSSGDLIGDSIRFIPILRHAQRKKWLEDSTIDCQSLDGVTGSRYGNCKECPYNKFEKGKPMACSLGHTFFVVTPDLNKIYRVDFQKSSAKAGKNILSLTEPPSLWGKIFVLSTEHHATAGRNYFSLSTQASGERPDAETLEVCGVLHQFFKAQYDGALIRSKNPSIYGNDATAATGDASDVVIETGDDGEIDFKGSM
jgi:hypothetical protein